LRAQFSCSLILVFQLSCLLMHRTMVGVLTRLHADDVEYIVSFASLWLKENTPEWKKEALASKETAFFLVGTSLYATNSKALTTLLATKGIGRAGMRVVRWSARLLGFSCDIVYRPGAVVFSGLPSVYGGLLNSF